MITRILKKLSLFYSAQYATILSKPAQSLTTILNLSMLQLQPLVTLYQHLLLLLPQTYDYPCYPSTWKASSGTRATCLTFSSLRSHNLCSSKRSGFLFMSKDHWVTTFQNIPSESQRQTCSCFLRICFIDPVMYGMGLLLVGARTAKLGSTSSRVSMTGLLASRWLSREILCCLFHSTLQPQAMMTTSLSQFLIYLNISRSTHHPETRSSLAQTATALASLAPEDKSPGTTSWYYLI